MIFIVSPKITNGVINLCWLILGKHIKNGIIWKVDIVTKKKLNNDDRKGKQRSTFSVPKRSTFLYVSRIDKMYSSINSHLIFSHHATFFPKWVIKPNSYQMFNCNRLSKLKDGFSLMYGQFNTNMGVNICGWKEKWKEKI